jgi:prophage maintenance system killer protein
VVFSGSSTLTGDVDTVLANASRYDTFAEKQASVIRDIAGRHLFDNGNKRTAQAVVEQLYSRNGISGPGSATIRSVIDQVSQGTLRDVEAIAKALGG